MIAKERPDIIPLSFAQQRLWFLDQLLPGSALYNVPLSLRLKGALDLQALESALNSLVRRHESLRTIFPAAEKTSYQLILPHLSLHLIDNRIDLSHLPLKEAEKITEEIASNEALAPFSLSEGPLLRVKLISLAKEDHALLVTMHHIISDGWSMGVFFKELSSLYNTYAKGSAPSLHPLSIQYADFALWQRKWLQGEVLEAQLTYWKNQLSGIPDLSCC